MPNPYLPNQEYVPDGEPHVFGDRVYIYGSHDLPASDHFCDYRLKVWSAPVHNLGHWTCHGDIFRTRETRDYPSDTDWTDQLLYAPDVVQKGDKYYLYSYIVGNKGCVAVADKPEGPFTFLSHYQYGVEEALCDNGQFIDPGVLVDDDGKVYIYCGYTRSYAAQINEDNMYEIIDDTFVDGILPSLPMEEDAGFFEAPSPRKINGLYYLIYSPNKGSRLAYATSTSPLGPFTYRGYIVDNSENYPAGNNHGSLCEINGQWYIFYHRMTNHSLMSRRGCMEPVEIAPDGSIKQVPMTSSGCEKALNPYEITKAELACHLTGDCFVTERNIFERVITNITNGSIMGYRYFDFGENSCAKTMEFHGKIRGMGCHGQVHICLDAPDMEHSIGSFSFGTDSGIVSCVLPFTSGIHSLYFIVEHGFTGSLVGCFEGRCLFEFEEFCFTL